jgi:sigma-B regulation protein RsbU (phosphoserine phosphatase)
MGSVGYFPLREQLLDRRKRLQSFTTNLEPPPDLVRLLSEVDSALKRMDEGSYGLCETCHDPIEKDRLAADPLVRFCVDHLTPSELNALQQDLELASRIQAALLPRNHLRLGGWEVCYHYKAAGAVSGDYCDVVHPGNPEDGFVFLLGDVSGKGVASSLLMSHLHAMFRTLLALDLPLDQMMKRANRLFCESTLPTSFATLVCGRATRSGEIEISNAGHCPPLVMNGAAHTMLEATGLPLGMFCDAEYSINRIRLEPRQGIFLYTDGLTEARSPSGAEYGAEQLSLFLEGCRTLAPRAVAESCLENLTSFLSGAPQADDVTIMVIQRLG